MANDNAIEFYINGQLHKVGNGIHPATRLSDYLRQEGRLKGTKVMCREGGCGTCVVTAEFTDPATKKNKIRAINSCLCPITTVRGWHITTTEGLGNQRDGFHPIQQAMADHSATQCGYCTPGIVLSAYGALKDKPTISAGDLEKALDGNLCRCTGYRSIVDAMKSLTVDGGRDIIDIEELLKVRCKKIPTCPKPRPDIIHRPESFNSWLRPQSLDQLLDLLDSNKDKATRLVFGNTATGVYKQDHYQLYVDIHDIPELYNISVKERSLVVSANFTLTDLQEVCRENQTSTGFSYLGKLSDYIQLIGNKPIRNSGSWAGNLVIQHDHPEFPSDMYNPLEAIDAKLTIASKAGTVTMTPSELMSVDMRGKVIVSVTLPALGEHDVFQVTKVMPRNSSAHSYVNAAFTLKFTDASANVAQTASVVFGGLGKGKYRMLDVEKYLTNTSRKDAQFIPGCLAVLEASLHEADNDPLVSPGYKTTLVRNILYKFLLGVSGGHLPPSLSRPPITGTQTFGTNPAEYPITKPIPHLSGQLKASGEIEYMDDMPRLEGELSAVLVLSTIGKGELDTIDTSKAMTEGGAIDVVTAADIPGKNVMQLMQVMQIFADKTIEYHGQPVAMVLADDLSKAYKAASLVKVTYKNVQTPITDIDQAIKNGDFHLHLPPRVIGKPHESLAGCSKVIEGAFYQGSQYHFFLENQSCLCVPREGAYDVWTSSQYPDNVQRAIAEALNVKAHRIRVTVPMIGGGFGGKILSASHIAALCSVGTHKTNRAVRLISSLDASMKLTGHRPAVRATYEIGVDSSNTIQAVVADVFWNDGHGSGLGAYFLNKVITHVDGMYHIPNWSVTGHSVKTNVQISSAMRAPGQLTGCLMAHHMMEHVAHVIGEPLEQFKYRHLYKQGQMMLCLTPRHDNSIRELWDAAVSSSNVVERTAQIAEFNKKNRWIKRGLAIAPSRYTITYLPLLSYPVYIAVYHHDGSVVISHGGCEMGQGLNTKVTQVASKHLDIPMELITVYHVNTLTSPNTCYTAGSQTSEYLCRTVAECCKILLEKLSPIREKNPEDNWQTLLEKAHNAGINMAVTERHSQPETSRVAFGSDYDVCGVCVAEAEVDILTGQNQILRVDMHMDVGQSVNPDVDIGQIEGALVMGLGLMLREREVFSAESGRLLTTSTWDYKPPTSADIPANINISLMKDRPNKLGVYSSKAIGEPAIVGSPAFLYAVKQTISESRRERGKTDHFNLFAPATPDVIVKASDVSTAELLAC